MYRNPTVQSKVVASLFLLALAMAYAGSKVLLPPAGAADFRYFWLAGDLWKSGINPYGPVYLERAREIFSSGNVPQQWAYPPHFRPISEILAFFPLEISAYIWRFLGAAAIAAGAFLLLSSVKHTIDVPKYISVLVIAGALTMSATAISVAIGQSSPLIFLGYSIFVYAYLTERRAAMIMALILLMIKPTYGLIPCFFLLAHLRYFRIIVLAASITILLSVWGLWGSNVPLVVSNVLEAFASYADDPVNSAAEMTGLRHIVYLSGAGDTSQLIYVAIGSGLAFCLGLAVRHYAPHGVERIRGAVTLGFLILMFAPLHAYDGYFALAIAIPALSLSRAEKFVCIALFFVTWRSNNLAELTGLRLPETLYSVGGTLETIASITAFAIFSLLLIRRKSVYLQDE